MADYTVSVASSTGKGGRKILVAKSPLQAAQKAVNQFFPKTTTKVFPKFVQAIVTPHSGRPQAIYEWGKPARKKRTRS